MSWKKTDSILDNILRKNKVFLKDKISEAWNKCDQSDKAVIKYFRNGELTLKAQNSAFLQELSMNKQNIKKEMNNYLKSDCKIKRINISLGGTN
ncbi:MAG: DciA family protein [Elusimicrobiota bacterium]